MRLLLISLLAFLVVCPSQANIFNDMMNQIRGIFDNYEEVPYTVVNHVHDYQKRSYPSLKWVCKQEVNNMEVGNDLSKLFWPLFKYISGANERKEKIKMTVPVTTKFLIHSPREKTYEMCFFLGSKHQEEPPMPQPESGVFIQERPEMDVLTRTVGGYITKEAEWMEEAGKLSAILQEHGISVNLTTTYWVGYDSPMKFWFRRNEVWFPIEK